MTDQGGSSGSGGGNTGLALIVGGLLVVVAVIAFFLFSNSRAPEAPSIPEQVDVNVNLPEVPAPPSNGG